MAPDAVAVVVVQPRRTLGIERIRGQVQVQVQVHAGLGSESWSGQLHGEGGQVRSHAPVPAKVPSIITSLDAGFSGGKSGADCMPASLRSPTWRASNMRPSVVK
jgi:hypothetical protein